MPIKIHWGPPGSYKTSGAVWDDVVPAIKSGRLVVTNIRGMSKERCLNVFPDAHADFEMIAINLDSDDGIERCRTWASWVPAGALIIFDEAGLVFLKAWKEKDLRQFDFPGGIDAAAAAGRPYSWLDSWTRHRHFNWDIVLTTPSIKYVRDDIRLACENAYKHSNFGNLGSVVKLLLGDYKEVYHDAQVSVVAKDAIVGYRRINKKVFELYDSTQTGDVKEHSFGSSIFKSVKLLVVLFILVVCIIRLVSTGGVSIGADVPVVAETVSSGSKISFDENITEVDDVSDGVLPDEQDGVVNPIVRYLGEREVFISGSADFGQLKAYYLEVIDNGMEPDLIDVRRLVLRGFTIDVVDDCLVGLKHNSQSDFVYYGCRNIELTSLGGDVGNGV